MAKQYWLLKSEPSAYSIDNLEKDKQTDWTGVRNFQARNTLREGMKKGDLAFFYHSSAEPTGIAGIAEIASDAHPDPTAFDERDDHYDPKSSPAKPMWFSRTVKFVKKFKEVVPLADLRKTKGLENMVLLQKGSRLSVQPVTEKEWEMILKLVK